MISRILLAGGTGLIGRRVADRLGRRRDVTLIKPVRSGGMNGGVPIDFARLCETPEPVLRAIAPDGLDVGISCLGTTIGQAGSHAAMYKVDHDYVLAIAEGARQLGARHFILMTAAGAGGLGFYLRTKGEIERAVGALGFERVDLIRPGFLLGARVERRIFEAIGQRLFAALNPLLLGPLSRYGAVQADAVADAIVALTRATSPGRYIQENRDLRALAGR